MQAYKLFKKMKGTLGQKFFSARVVDLWNDLDLADKVTGLQRRKGCYRKIGLLSILWLFVIVLTQTLSLLNYLKPLLLCYVLLCCIVNLNLKK